VYAPLVVARQWWKYVIGSQHLVFETSWNESCLPAHQTIALWQGRKTIAELMHDMNHPVRSVNDRGVIVPNRIKAIWPQGEAEVFRLRDELNNTVLLTATHRVLTPTGYRPVAELAVGDQIAHNGVLAYQDADWLLRMARSGKGPKAIAAIAGVTDRTIVDWFKRLGLGRTRDHHLWNSREWLEEHYVRRGLSQAECAELAGCTAHTIRKSVTRFGLQQDQVARMQEHNRRHGVWGKGETALTNEKIALRGQAAGRTRRGRPAYASGADHHAWKGDAAANTSTHHWRARRIAARDRCEVCSSTVRVQVHHRDADPTNNDRENLIALCEACHKTIHGRWLRVFAHARLVEKTSVGSMPVFDVEMEIEPNFVAGNIVVHNSRRYVTEQPRFYVVAADGWRSAPENRKQGSGGPLPVEIGAELTARLIEAYERGLADYEAAVAAGVAVEQARLFLPAYGLYVRWRWTASLLAIAHFLRQRLAPDAQHEIGEYAAAVRELVESLYPESLSVLLNDQAS
jgi:thymidylate synthase ThyX